MKKYLKLPALLLILCFTFSSCYTWIEEDSIYTVVSIKNRYADYVTYTISDNLNENLDIKFVGKIYKHSIGDTVRVIY